jgi:hypothetical protein
MLFTIEAKASNAVSPGVRAGGSDPGCFDREIGVEPQFFWPVQNWGRTAIPFARITASPPNSMQKS